MEIKRAAPTEELLDLLNKKPRRPLSSLAAARRPLRAAWCSVISIRAGIPRLALIAAHRLCEGTRAAEE